MINAILCIWIFNSINGKIQGTVVDYNSKDPIPYANVIVLNTELGTATDEDGAFFILNVPSNIYTVEISCVGYQTQQITDVIVETNQTARLKVLLKQAPVEMEPITVVSETPYVQKDWTSATYIIRESEIATLPIDYTTSLITFQPSVVNVDTALHVRGGRASEVNYMIDNVSIIDPLTGEPAIFLSKGIVDEIVFLPGGYDVEYGRAMSGIINIITERPKDRLSGRLYGKTETIMPYYYDFGYQDYQGTVHLPVSQRFKGLVSLDLMHTNDWDPQLYILPHKQRDDYSIYSKWALSPSGKLKLSLCGAKSRSQFDRYNPMWIFHPEDFRSDFRKGDVEILNISYLPDSRKVLNLTLSRLYTRVIYGVREDQDVNFLDDFTFRDYQTYRWYNLSSNKNPFGVWLPYYMNPEGTYTELRDRTSCVMKSKISANLQIHRYHELKAGFEYVYQDFYNFTYFVSNDTLDPIIDEWQHFPQEYCGYIQDNIDYKGFYAKIGCRFDYLSGDINGIEPKVNISPRFGFSFLVTDRFLFRANVGRYTQPPLYDYMYSYYNLLPFPYHMWYVYKTKPIGNPNLNPEETISYEVGFQGNIYSRLNASVNVFYKDISDLTGTRFIQVDVHRYTSYFNTEYANVKGVEVILEFKYPILSGKLSYTLSWARGTSSYAQEVFDIYSCDTTYVPASNEYYLNFDQRHKFFIQAFMSLPLQTKIHLFTFLGTGFPYTPPGQEGKTIERNSLRFSPRYQIDCVISKTLKIKGMSLGINIEIINILDKIYQTGVYNPVDVPPRTEFNDFIDLTSPYYHPACDLNHDGIIIPYEEYTSYRNLADFVNDDIWIATQTSSRRARIGISMHF